MTARHYQPHHKSAELNSTLANNDSLHVEFCPSPTCSWISSFPAALVPGIMLRQPVRATHREAGSSRPSAHRQMAVRPLVASGEVFTSGGHGPRPIHFARTPAHSRESTGARLRVIQQEKLTHKICKMLVRVQLHPQRCVKQGTLGPNPLLTTDFQLQTPNPNRCSIPTPNLLLTRALVA